MRTRVKICGITRQQDAQAAIAAETLADVCIELLGDRAQILGPAPASIMRVARRYRWQILLKFSTGDREHLPDLNILRTHCPKSVAMTIDAPANY